MGLVARETVRGMRRNLGTSLAAVLCVAVSLSLLGMAMMARQAVDNASARWQDGVEFIVFTSPDVSDADTKRLADALDADSRIDSVIYFDQQQALDEFTAMFADTPDMVEMVTADILPASFRVNPVDPSPAAVEQLVDRYEQFGGVIRIARSTDAIDTISSVTSFLTTWGVGIAVVLAVAAMLMIATTVQLAVYNRRHDIEVMQLVGASNRLIRAPFVAEGLVFGLVGAAIAAGSLRVFQPVLDSRLPSDTQFPLFGELSVATVNLASIAGSVLVLGTLVGAAAAAVSVTWFTRKLS